MSTWSRQLSTFERSLVSGSSISVDSLMTRKVRACFDEPCPGLLGGNRRVNGVFTPMSRAAFRRPDSAVTPLGLRCYQSAFQALAPPGAEVPLTLVTAPAAAGGGLWGD